MASYISIDLTHYHHQNWQFLLAISFSPHNMLTQINNNIIKILLNKTLFTKKVT